MFTIKFEKNPTLHVISWVTIHTVDQVSRTVTEIILLILRKNTNFRRATKMDKV